ncbi:YitT family protein [Roseburia hominis]
MSKKVNLKEYAVIIIGMFIISAGIYYVMMPGGFVLGSLAGLVVVLVNFIPLSVSTLTFILNVILLLIGFVCIGKEFGGKTVFASMLLSVYLWIFERLTPKVSPLTGDILIDMLCFLLMLCFGQALLFNVNASSGGLDIVAKLLNKYLYLDLGKAVMFVGFATAATSILIYDRKVLVVSLLGTYLSGIVLDNFIDGFHMRKRVCIISQNYQAILDFIFKDLNRGATLYSAYGGLNHEEKVEITTILEKNEYGRLLAYIHENDPTAFMTVSSVGEVIGKWNENRRRIG